MALVVKDRVKETTATTGTGTLTLAGAVSGFQTFASALSNADTTYYAIREDSTGEWEVGLGTFTASGTLLSRDTILESSNAGSAINLTVGSAEVFITYPAEKSVYLDASGDVTSAAGQIDISNFNNDSGYSTTTGTVTSVAASAGTGISISGSPITTSGTLTITNTAPDQTVVLTEGSNVTITGTYPNFTIASTDTNTTYSAGDLLDLSGTTFNVDLSELTDMTATMVGTDEFVVLDASAQRRKAANEIGLSIFNNDAGFWNASNDGSGSGLDADTLDGVQGANYLRSDTSDVGTTVEFNGGVTYDPSGGGAGSDTATDVGVSLSSGTRIVGYNSGYIRTLLEWNASSDIQIGQGGTSLIGGIDLLPGSSGTAKVNGSRILTVSDEGSGNGLDADTLDGAQPSVAAVNSTIVQRHSSGYIYANYFNTTPNTVSSGVTQVCVETGNDGFIRHGNQAAIRDFIGAGSGNGLDADLLDGQEGSYYTNAANLTGTIGDVFSASTRYNIGLIDGSSSNTRDKLRVWSSAPYSIGMKSGFTYGALNDYAMSFQMSDTTDRGFWWGDSTHTDAQGAMSLTTDGRATIATSLSVGGGESRTTAPTSTLEVVGTASATDFNSTSDLRYKEDLEQIDNALSKVLGLTGYTFKFKDEDERRAGLIAQEVEKVLPEAVGGNEEKKTLAYGNLVALLVEAIKEQQLQIEELKARVP